MRNRYAGGTVAVTVIVALSAIAWLLTSPRTDKDLAAIDELESSLQADVETPMKETTLVSAAPVIDRDGGYVGSDACIKCHEDYYQSWHTSYHRTMTQQITAETAPAAIVDTTVEVNGDEYKFTRRDNDIFVELNDPIDDGKLRTRRMLLMTGSHHAHVFWYESGYDKTPAQLQIMYIIDEQRWVPRRSFFLRPPHLEKENELGRWNAVCSSVIPLILAPDPTMN